MACADDALRDLEAAGPNDYPLWTRTENGLPPKGEVVETISPGGIQSQLMRDGKNGRLWFVPDGSMYVYYEPEFWRPVHG